jgi:antirestriction protein
MAPILRREDWLKDRLPEQIDPVEERYFADLLAVMNPQEMTILKAAVERNIHPGGMKELIDLANSVGDWPVASGVHNDAQLGRFLYDYDFLPDEEHEAATMKLNITYYPEDYLAAIGRKHREAEGGFYTSLGYVENHGVTEAVIPDDYKLTATINGGEVSLDSMRTDAPISAFITNLGKYNEGELVGKWHSFPTTPEEIQQTLKEIGIGGRYEEFFITDYETDVGGIYDTLPEYASLDELNYLAAKLDGLSDWEIRQFEAAAELGDHSNDLAGLINLTENLDSFDYLHDVSDDSDLGYYWVEESGVYDKEAMGNLSNYIDYERFGRDIRLEEGGTFTDNGYIANREGLSEIYGGIEDIPDEYRVFSLPDEQEMESGEPATPSAAPEKRPSAMDKLAAAKDSIVQRDAEKPAGPEQSAEKPKPRGPEL